MAVNNTTEARQEEWAITPNQLALGEFAAQADTRADLKCPWVEVDLPTTGEFKPKCNLNVRIEGRDYCSNWTL